MKNPTQNLSIEPAYQISEDAYTQLQQVQDSLRLLEWLAGNAREAGSCIPPELLTAHLNLVITPLKNALSSAKWQGTQR